MTFNAADVFVQGPIDPAFARECAEAIGANPAVGAHLLFLGQIRADRLDAGVVRGIEYTAHQTMAQGAFTALVDRAAAAGGLLEVTIRHSLGYVPVGGASLLIAVGAGHRDEAYRLSRDILEAIKKEVPIYGREITEDDQSRWKVNR